MTGQWKGRAAGLARRGLAVPLMLLAQRDQEQYMRRMAQLLRAQGVRFEGMPVFVSSDVRIDRSALVTLCDRCVISSGVMILTHDFSLDRYSEEHGLIERDREFYMTAPVRVGAYSFIGMQAMILPGVTVGPGAIVGARSLVTKDVPSGMVVGGVPARPIKSVSDAYWSALSSGSWRTRPRAY